VTDPNANDYTTLATVNARISRSDGLDDAMVSAQITAASRAIDGYCNRQFYQVTSTRYFTADNAGIVTLDDIVSISGLATDISGTRQYDTSWQPTDYDFLPDNAVDFGFPYTAIIQRPLTSLWFPTIRRSIQVTGTWGWPSIPAPVAEACAISVVRLWTRKDSPFGVLGSAELGAMTLPKFDPDVQGLLAPYRRITVGGF
jgi:hypothetical protein